VRLAVLRFAQAGMCTSSHGCGSVHLSVQGTSSAAVSRVCHEDALAWFVPALLSNAGGEPTRMNMGY